MIEAWSVPNVPSVGSESRERLALPCKVMVGSRLLSATLIVVVATSTSKPAASTAGWPLNASATASSRLRGSRRSIGSAGLSRDGAAPITAA